MTCYHPIQAYYKPGGGIAFNSRDGYADRPVKIKCGQCIGCRLDYSRQWAVRCINEAQMWAENSFITLTYSPEYLPENGFLVKRHFQLFMKRLRKRFPNRKIRFLHCGEYGEKKGRPHYHAIIFNLDFPDKTFYKCSNGFNYYQSKILNGLWKYGISVIGDVTFESCAYVARYITKKVNGDLAEEHYEYVVPDTGEIIQQPKEYVTMSRMPGIGYDFYKKYTDDIYPDDCLFIRNNVKCGVPRYYDELLKLDNPKMYSKVKRQRHIKNSSLLENSPTLEDKEQVKLAQYSKLIRKLEKEIQ